jgi:hypothetical protein
MCNLHRSPQTTPPSLFRVMNRYVGNLPPMPGVFPDYPAPVVRNVGAEHDALGNAASARIACPMLNSPTPTSEAALPIL